VKNSPTYYRARIDVIQELVTSPDAKEENIPLLRNGVFPDSVDSEGLIADRIKKQNYNDEPLTFFELTRFNTWFNLYPEKVCGVEQITTSREFPIQIKGTREDIVKTIHIEESQLELEALALEVELQLLKV